MSLTIDDYKLILRRYKTSIPREKEGMRKKVEGLLGNKLCRCIKKVGNISNVASEGKAIGICTRSIFKRNGLHRGTFKCKTPQQVNIKKTRKNITGKSILALPTSRQLHITAKQNLPKIQKGGVSVNRFDFYVNNYHNLSIIPGINDSLPYLDDKLGSFFMNYVQQRHIDVNNMIEITGKALSFGTPFRDQYSPVEQFIEWLTPPPEQEFDNIEYYRINIEMITLIIFSTLDKLFGELYTNTDVYWQGLLEQMEIGNYPWETII